SWVFWFPVVRPEVLVLYRKLVQPPGILWGLPLLVSVIVLEEILWRGTALTLLYAAQQESKVSAVQQEPKSNLPWRAIVLSAGLYAFAQSGQMSWLLVIAALCCGMVWNVIYTWRKNLWTSLICHLVWDLILFLVWPLEQLSVMVHR
ncbi:MAG: CPBP family intramembrane glutamic endopeptidase, partial [Myxococcota bacterium]